MARFRLIKPLPEVLTYRGGAKLTLGRSDGLYGDHFVRYFRADVVADPVTIYRGLSESDADQMMKLGFEVADNGPAVLILRSLVARGYLEEL